MYFLDCLEAVGDGKRGGKQIRALELLQRGRERRFERVNLDLLARIDRGDSLW
jgi:hypothetical protein